MLNLLNTIFQISLKVENKNPAITIDRLKKYTLNYGVIEGTEYFTQYRYSLKDSDICERILDLSDAFYQIPLDIENIDFIGFNALTISS